MRTQLTSALRAALVSLGAEAPETIHLEVPANRDHGDFSSNIALATAKKLGKAPREFAAEIIAQLESSAIDHVDQFDIAGPGFINVYLQPSWLHTVLHQVLDARLDYGRSTIGENKKVLVEFVSANPTGPVHAGHARGAAYGDSIARLFEFTGHEVEREFYINDRGVQMQVFADSLIARKNNEEPPEEGYKGQYIIDWAQEMPDDVDPLLWGQERALSDQRNVLDRMNVHFDTWFSERALVETGAIESTLNDLRASGEAYEEDGALWLRTTDRGDTKDRVLIKSDGEFTYFLPDIAYHRNKYDRGFDLVFNVWGADHHGYVPRMNAAVQFLGHPPESFEVAITQMVRLERNGEEVKISKRTGNIITLEELLDEAGPDAVRLTYLLQSVDSPQTVDLDLIIAESNENPVFYVQMANARIQSISRVAQERGIARPAFASVDLSVLTHERELEILRVLESWPQVTITALRERAPHKVTTWVRTLAAAVHGFYHDCPILADSVDPAIRDARWWLAEGAGAGLQVGLELLGMTAPDRM